MIEGAVERPLGLKRWVSWILKGVAISHRPSSPIQIHRANHV